MPNLAFVESTCRSSSHTVKNSIQTYTDMFKTNIGNFGLVIHLLTSFFSRNVGLFRYYTLKQIPNIALALPVLFVSVLAVVKFASSDIQRFMTAGLRVTQEIHPHPFFSSLLVPYIYHWMLLLAVCVTVLHTQVSTRFLSATPPLYWFGSYLLSQSEKYRLLCNAWIFWSAVYLPVGTILFTNFFPWT
jgi:phosphatidylinositol glycan class V